MSKREDLLNNISVGNIIAFTDTSQEMYSGRVVEIKDKTLVVRTKNGSVFFVDRSHVTWVKNGTRWPTGIFNALKYTKSHEVPVRPV